MIHNKPPEYVDEDSFLWLAHDLPNPGQYAEALLMMHRDLARELLAARKTDTGWKFRFDPDGLLITELRRLGLADVAGAETPHRSSGPGWHVTSFGLVVRNRLLSIIAQAELVAGLENGD